MEAAPSTDDGITAARFASSVRKPPPDRGDRPIGRWNALVRRAIIDRFRLSLGCRMSSCVLAYSGGLDTSIILGWLMDEGYDVHCVYVDLGQPCEDREAILKKARDIGAKSARI